MRYIYFLILAFPLVILGDWRRIETEHFSIFYEKQFSEMGKKVAIEGEQLYKKLSKCLKNKPLNNKIVISDIVDDSNGFARVIPYNLVHLYPFPPEPNSELGYYDDWLYLLLTHEFTHITHISQMGPIHKFINKILGTTVAPNQLLPTWLKEGIAVFFESLYTGFGRINSPYYGMIFRSSIYNKPLTLSQLSNYTQYYPYGGIPYLYGTFFIKYLMDKGEGDYCDKLSKFIDIYGKQLIPYGINGAFKKATGETFTNNYNQFIKFYKKKFNKLYKKLEKKGFTKFRSIAKTKTLSFFRKNGTKQIESLTTDGENLYYLTSGVDSLPELYRYVDKKNKKIVKFDSSVSSIEFYRGKLFYTSFKKVQNRYVREFRYMDIDQKFESSVTKNLRVTTFALDKNSFNVALVVNENGSHNLYIYNLKTKKIDKVTHFSPFTTIGTPHFINSKQIVFTKNGDYSFWDLFILNIDSKKIDQITNDLYIEYSPIYNQKDNSIYFISDREDKILNIYRYDIDSSIIYKKTNFFTGLKQIVYNFKKDLFYGLHYKGNEGFEVIEIDPKDMIDKGTLNSNIDHNFETFSNFQNVKIDKVNFTILPEFLPQNISPSIESSNFRNRVAIEIENSDIRDFYHYSIYLSYQFEHNSLLFSLFFSDISHFITYSVGYSFTPYTNDNLFVNSKQLEYEAEYHTFSFSMGYPFFNFKGFNQFYISASHRYYTHSKLNYEFKPWDNIPILPDQYDRFRLSGGFYYSDVDYLLYTPGGTNGDLLNLQFGIRDKDIYAEYNSLYFAFLYKKYIPIQYFYSAFSFQYSFRLSYSENGTYNIYLGGYPDLGSLTDMLIDRTAISGIYLRGYPPSYFKGNSLNILNIEYKHPIYYPNFGYSTIPFYIHKVYLKLFYDIASIGEDFYDFNLKQGFGAELSTNFLLGYLESYNLSLGYSYGFNEGGEHQFYLTFTSNY